jgi:hypothetical protein
MCTPFADSGSSTTPPPARERKTSGSVCNGSLRIAAVEIDRSKAEVFASVPPLMVTRGRTSTGRNEIGRARNEMLISSNPLLGTSACSMRVA